MTEHSPQALSRRRVLVTGASGFLGTALCRALVATGAEVCATSRVPQDTQDGGPRWWQLEPEDATAVRELFAKLKPEVVYHLSGYASAAATLDLVLPMMNSVMGSTVHVLLAATECGCPRVIVPASLDEPEYGVDPAPGSPYAAAKAAMNVWARMFHAVWKTPVVCVRPFMTYGPGQSPQKVIPYTILSLLNGKRPRISSAKRLVDWIYVDDVVDGMVAAATVPDLDGETLDLGTGRLVAVRDVVEQLIRLTGGDVGADFDAPAQRPLETTRAADVDKSRLRLGWSPRVSLEEGLAATVDWYRQAAVRQGGA